ncbi:MAG: flagellar hook-length control protein FliK [Spirochaetaceae bacterium]|jgi:flagellar hook-length control protein FliK|nr:flagellar hook-length control protein FliK [Spirochaetaceae bacterium]
MTAESSNKPDFSEYLATLDEKAVAMDSHAVSDESSATAESTAGTDEDKTLTAAESAAGGVFPAPSMGAPIDGGKADGEEAAPAESGRGMNVESADGTTEALSGAANNVLTEEPGKSPALRLAEAAAMMDGEGEATSHPADAEKNGAAGDFKAIPPDKHGKPFNTPEDGDGIKPSNVNEWVYVDKNPPELDEQLAADREDTVPTEPAVGTTKISADSKASEAADLTLNSSTVLSRAAAPLGAPNGGEKNGGAQADGEKKSQSGRTRRNTAAERVGSVASAERSGNVGGTSRGAENQGPRQVSAAPEAEIKVNLPGAESGGGGREGAAGGAKPAVSFETFLARELQQNLNGDIVRQAQVLLREGGEGTIRLSLKPESLGKVKISLEMTENKITGKIVVESGEALRAFEHEMESLEQTFRGEGFDGASLSLELAEHQEPGGGEGEWRPGSGNISTKTASSRYDGNAAGVYFGTEYSAKQINVLV